ncbi:protein amalgam-like [Antedon mediterranea]|uniref:protein amalgam-like n=1 Tax=Antedon mediterranea TaxID=105859 RepID=UPI003AF6B638
METALIFSAPGKIIQIEPMSTRTLGSKDPNARYFKESRDVVLFCIADGKPSPTVTWHRTNLQKELNDTRFKDCGQGVARIWNVKVEDTGDYVCTAANHLNDAEGDRQIVKLIIKYKPRIKPSRQLYRSGIGRYVCMACCIDAFPVPDAVTWFQNTTVLSNRQPGISITGDEKRTRLCISKIEARHYGNFTCRVTNDVGYTDVNIVLTGTPTTPTIVSSVISSWSTRYLLRWKASKRVEESHRNVIPINGFIIKYQYVWQTGEGQQVIKYISKGAIPTKSSVYEYYIENLHPDWSYKATVSSTNDFGESDESTPIYFITTELLVEETSKEKSLTPEKRICPQVGDMASALPSSSRANVRSVSQLLFTFCLLSITLTFGT